MISENMILQVMIMILQIMIVKRKEKHSQIDRAVAMIHGLSTRAGGRPLCVRPSPGRPARTSCGQCQQPPETQQRQPYIRQPESGNRREAPSPDSG
jgi:hypothetical protein